MKSLENFRGVYEDLNKCVADFKGILSYLNVEEGSLKVLNDEFGANLELLEMTLKSAQAKL